MSSRRYEILEFLTVLIELFTIGIFSVQGGAKAWFELILLIAVLFACGYLAWWELSFLILAIILGTLAAGIFAIIAPQYVNYQNLEAQQNKFSATQLTIYLLNKISVNKVGEVNLLSGLDLSEYLIKLEKALEIFRKYPDLLEKLSELNEIFNNIDKELSFARDKAQKEQQARAQKEQQEADLHKQRQEAEQQQQRQLIEKRREFGFAGGFPPDDSYDPPICPANYTIKVTLYGTDDGYDGIIWKPEDGKKYDVKPVWCFESVTEAEKETNKKLRRPKNKST
jgi:signal transduction histidine kinase